MPRNTAQLNIELLGKNKTKRAFVDARRDFDSLKKGLAVGAGAITAALGYSVKKAADFEQRMADISTLISGDSTKAIAKLRKGILDMTKTIPRSADELGAAAYDILSAGIEGTSTQLKVLESASKLGVAGLGSTSESVDILTSAINAFGLDANDADSIANVLFKTVKFGKTNIAEMSRSFGDASASMVAAGVSLQEFSAATAALTTTGSKASVVQNQIRAATQALITPNKRMRQELDKLGYSSGVQLVKTHDMVGAFKQLYKSVDGNKEAMGEMLGSNEAFAAVMPLITTLSQSFNDNLEQMNNGLDAMNPAFQKASSTMKNRFLIGLEAVNRIAIAIGQAFSKVFGADFDAIIRKLHSFADQVSTDGTAARRVIEFWLAVMKQLVEWVKIGWGVFQQFVLAFAIEWKTTIKPALISVKELFQTIFSYIGKAISTVSSLIAKVGTAVANIGRAIWNVIKGIVDKIADAIEAVAKLLGMGSKAPAATKRTTSTRTTSTPKRTDYVDSWRRSTPTKKRSAPKVSANWGSGAPGWARLAEGGIVSAPTEALIGEAGPEAVIPLEKAGMMGGVTINVQGNFVGSEEEAVRLGDIIMQRAMLNKRFSF